MSLLQFSKTAGISDYFRRVADGKGLIGNYDNESAGQNWGNELGTIAGGATAYEGAIAASKRLLPKVLSKFAPGLAARAGASFIPGLGFVMLADTALSLATGVSPIGWTAGKVGDAFSWAGGKIGKLFDKGTNNSPRYAYQAPGASRSPGNPFGLMAANMVRQPTYTGPANIYNLESIPSYKFSSARLTKDAGLNLSGLAKIPWGNVLRVAHGVGSPVASYYLARHGASSVIDEKLGDMKHALTSIVPDSLSRVINDDNINKIPQYLAKFAPMMSMIRQYGSVVPQYYRPASSLAAYMPNYGGLYNTPLASNYTPPSYNPAQY